MGTTGPSNNTPSSDNNGQTPHVWPEEFHPDVVFTDEGVILPSLNLRSYALEQGILVDVSETAAEAGFLYPVAVTKTLWDDIQAIPENHSHEDPKGRLWDVLIMARYAIQESPADGSELLYRLVLHVDDRSAYTVKLTVGPGDTREPVFTLSSAEKDKDVSLGEVRITEGALSMLAEAQASPVPFLARHKQGDWGEGIDEHDWKANDQALQGGTRIISAYTLEGAADHLWIITEWDRRVTTVLLPSEY